MELLFVYKMELLFVYKMELLFVYKMEFLFVQNGILICTKWKLFCVY